MHLPNAVRRSHVATGFGFVYSVLTINRQVDRGAEGTPKK